MRTLDGFILLVTSLALGGCEPVVTTATGTTGGAGAGTTSVTGTGGTSVTGAGGAGGAPVSTTVSTSVTTSTTTSTSSTTSTGGVCPGSCSNDAECQASCPASPNAVACCDPNTALCYLSATPTCPDPQPQGCAPGALCNPGETCLGWMADCEVSCTCDTTGHYQCETGLPPPACAPEPPSCNAPCTNINGATCHCVSADGDMRACSCSGPLFTWSCAPAGQACPPNVAEGNDCAQYADGQVCASGFCVCSPACGTHVWGCLDI